MSGKNIILQMNKQWELTELKYEQKKIIKQE